MEKIGWRVEDCAKELKRSVQHTYKLAREPDFPKPLAVFGTCKIWEPNAIRTYAAKRKNRRKRR